MVSRDDVVALAYLDQDLVFTYGKRTVYFRIMHHGNHSRARQSNCYYMITDGGHELWLRNDDEHAVTPSALSRALAGGSGRGRIALAQSIPIPEESSSTPTVRIKLASGVKLIIPPATLRLGSEELYWYFYRLVMDPNFCGESTLLFINHIRFPLYSEGENNIRAVIVILKALYLD